jgi:hypothetical protein
MKQEDIKNFLINVFPDKEIIENKAVPRQKNKTYRPDFLITEYKLVIEYLGEEYYKTPKSTVNNDILLQELEELGYNIISIPYFMNINNPEVQKLYFSAYIDYTGDLIEDSNIGDVGFTSKCLLPAEFSSLGLNKYKDFMTNLFRENEFLKNKIEESLVNIIETKKSLLQVLPVSYPILFLCNDCFDYKISKRTKTKVQHELKYFNDVE